MTSSGNKVQFPLFIIHSRYMSTYLKRGKSKIAFLSSTLPSSVPPSFRGDGAQATDRVLLILVIRLCLLLFLIDRRTSQEVLLHELRGQHFDIWRGEPLVRVRHHLLAPV